MNFGKYAIIDEITHHFKEEPEWFWKIKPPTSGDELEMSRFFVQGRVQQGVDGVRRDYPPTNLEVCHREIALTFAGTNIPKGDKAVEEGGDPILKDGAKTHEIEAVLRQMPQAMVLEVWGAIAEAIPGWGPAVPKVKSSEEETEEIGA
jgi:hypothetical protein